MRKATKLWIWRGDDEFPEKWIGVYDKVKSPDRFLFRAGKELESIGLKPRIHFEATTKQLLQWDVLPNNSASPIVNSKVVQILNEICEESVQFFDIEITTLDGIINEYKLLNITKTVSCINHNKSKYSFVAGTNHIMGFQKLVCRLDEITANLLAREVEYKSHKLIADNVYESLNSNNIRGVGFELCLVG